MTDETQAPLPKIEPVKFDKETFDFFSEKLSLNPDQATNILAKEIVGRIETDVPGFLSYDSLRDGTAAIFDYPEETRLLKSKDRALTDEQIIASFATNRDGSPITQQDFTDGFLRDLLPQSATAAGMYAGAKVGAKIGEKVGQAVGDRLAARTLGVSKLVLPPVKGQITKWEKRLREW